MPPATSHLFGLGSWRFSLFKQWQRHQLRLAGQARLLKAMRSISRVVGGINLDWHGIVKSEKIMKHFIKI
jgi:hypothetical protein